MNEKLLGWFFVAGIFLLFVTGIWQWLILYNKWFNNND